MEKKKLNKKIKEEQDERDGTNNYEMSMVTELFGGKSPTVRTKSSFSLFEMKKGRKKEERKKERANDFLKRHPKSAS